MKCKTAACLFLFTASLSAVPVYIGTNTGKGGGSKGIYLADFDAATGKLSQPELAAEYQNPGFLAEHPTKKVLLSIGAPKQAFPDGTGAVASFSIGPDHGLTFLGETSSAGKGPCHLAIDITGNTVAVANYGDGKIATIRLDDKGVAKDLVSVIANSGSGPNESRQQGPHAHGVYFDKNNTRLFVPDLGLDRVLIYPFDATTSKLGDEQAPFTVAPGAGPRHMAFNAKGDFAYVINELDNTVHYAAYRNGGFFPVGTVGTLPPDFQGKNTTAEIEVSPDGRHIYGSNRGHDSIVVYTHEPSSGKLIPIQHAPCGGKIPRHFKISPDGKWLLCGHQDSNTISVLPRNPETGELGAPTNTVSTPSPICILFPR